MQGNKKGATIIVGNIIKKSFIKAFTLTEVIIATFISTIILSFIFIFLSNIVEGIRDTRNEVTAMSSFYEFTNKLNNYRDIYITGSILVDTATGSDIFLMKDFAGENGVLLGTVKLLDNKLNTNSSVYDDKGIGFRKLSSSDLASIETDVNNIYDMVFQNDQIFKDLKVQDLILISYNSGKIFDLSLIVDLAFQNSLIGQLRYDLPKDTLKKFNIDF